MGGVRWGMLTLIKKTLSTLQNEGITETLYKAARYPFKEDNRSAERRILSLDRIEDRFTEIYKSRYWSSGLASSGVGSTLAYTENLRRELPKLFEKFAIRSVFDAPCGDFLWMRKVVRASTIDYTGGDIVLPLIEGLQAKDTSGRVKFIHIDLTKEALPFADLMICRACLYHLSYADTRRVLENFVASNIPYFLTTTHKGNFQNSDITTGYYRLMNLFAAPYNFPRDVLFRIDDWKAPGPQVEMCLWSRAQVGDALAQFGTTP